MLALLIFLTIWKKIELNEISKNLNQKNFNKGLLVPSFEVLI